MKIIGVVTLVLFLAAILSHGPGVPTQDVTYKAEAVTRNNNNNAAVPITSVNLPRLNPRHGEPGHRCDIRAGEPLDSKPAAPSKLVIPATSILPPAPPPGGLNPKHGQPGHRCDIAVGQPLNSKPSQAGIARTTAGTPLTASATPTATNLARAPLLNPRHGQPFHRCDIMVGEPLNSKPAAKRNGK